MALKFRRGTTAQQSGSLAFGEPYVNTTLGTLVVGGQTGDIVLSTSGTGSTGNFGAISGSGLDITGNANIAGNVTVGGQLQIGDATADTVNVVASLSSSLIPQTTNAFDLGSATKIWRDLYISSGSIKMYDGAGTLVSTITATSLNSNTSSVNALNSFTASQLTQNSALATISGSLISSASAAKTTNDAQDVSITNLNSTSASVNTSVASLNSFSASQLTQNSALATISGSLISSASADRVSITNINTTTASLNTSVSNLNSFSSSQLTQNSALATISGSLISTASNHEQRIAANESVSSSYARTNSANTFTGNQTISGSLRVTQDLVVLGSSSIQNITSSNLVIGAAYVTLNTNTPSSRFAGLQIIDSGSSGGSGSFLYDAEQDEFVFVHRGNGTNVTSSHFVMGPETYDNLGNETYLTNNRLPKGTGKEHLNDSQITDDGTTVSIAGNLNLTGSMNSPQWVTLGLYTASVEQRLTGCGVATGSLNTSVAELNSWSASAKIKLSNLETTSASVNTSIANINVATASLQTTSASVNTSVTNINTTTASLNTSIANINVATASLQTTSASVNTSVTNINTTTASLNTSVTNLNSYTSSFAAASVTLTNKTIAAGSNTISGLTNSNLSGTAGITNANLANSAITIAGTSTSLGGTITLATITGTSGIVSGSSQVTPLLPAGTVSGSSQVTLSSTTGGGTTANVQFGSLGIGTAASGVSGEIRATADITAYYSSDNRLKENIKPIENALDKVRKISGNTYDWKAGFEDIHSHTGEDVGVIAQEVEAVIPQLVTTREHGYKAVQYEKLAALLIEAIKEQQQHIDNLTLQVEELKKQKGL